MPMTLTTLQFFALVWAASLFGMFMLGAWFTIRGIAINAWGHYVGFEALLFRFFVSLAGIASFQGLVERLTDVHMVQLLATAFGGAH